MTSESLNTSIGFSMMDSDSVNSSIESEFELAEDAPTLARHVPAPRDRTTIAHSVAGKASFRAELERVQYGTFKGQRACLLTFTFLFYCKDQGRLRFDSAEIAIQFRRERRGGTTAGGGGGGGATTRPRPPRSPNDDDDDDYGDANPDNSTDVNILQLAPFRIYGALDPQTVERTLKLDAPIGFQTPIAGFHADLVPGIEKTTTTQRNFRMSVQGGRRSSTGTGRDDIAFWNVNENAVQRDGILPKLQTAVVLRWPGEGDGVVAHVRVTPTFKFSVLHALQMMRQRRDDPIAFDGVTSKGEPVDAGKDFADKTFDWARVLENPTEYQNNVLLV